MNCRSFLPLMLGIPLLWPRFTAAENSKAKEIRLPAESPWRLKREWKWDLFFVQEEMNETSLRIGQLRSDMHNGTNYFRYKLSGDGAGSIFVIDARTGDLYVVQRLDREKRAFYTLRAQVLDATTGVAVEPESEFVIKVMDVNDNEPKFLDEPYVAVVPEMSPEGTFVIQVTASDADDPSNDNNARLLYSLLQGQPYFSIEPTTGVVRISSRTDRELQDEYWVIIQAKDKLGQPGALSGTTSVLITLSDVNDNKPVFKESLYRMTVPESAPTGTSIGEILAHDDDIGDNARMEYSLEDDSQTFDIITDDETQEGIVILKKQVDFEQQSQYGVRAKVRNRRVDERLLEYHAEEATTFIKIQVEDADEPPVFLLPYYKFEVLEGSPQGSSVGTVSAADPDQRKSPVRYSISGSKAFQIDDTGTVVTADALDREIRAWYNLTLSATERYNAGQISEVPLFVEVLNINDHAPELPEDYETYVCENAGSGQVIQTISAVDRDESTEGHSFYFNLSVEDAKSSRFTIIDKQDNTAAILTNGTGFSLHEEPVFYLSILITDSGTPALTSTNTLTIRVCDCGDRGSARSCSGQRGPLSSVGVTVGIAVAVLVCAVLMLGFIFLILALNQGRKQASYPRKGEDVRENIFRYDDEGGGEDDTDAFDVAELGGRGRAVRRERQPRRGASAAARSPHRRSLQAGPDSAVIKQFILEKLAEADADADAWAPPFDTLQTYAFEGTGSSAGSLSSLGSAASDQGGNYGDLKEWGPRLKGLAYMLDSAVHSNR